jgi:hypothetical protein
MHRAVACAAVAGGVLLVEIAPALATNYVTPANVNLLKHVSSTGALDTTVGWTNLNNGGSAQYGAFYTIDSGHWQSQINYSSASPSNTASLQMSLAQPQFINTLVQTLIDTPATYRVWGSNTGFSGMTDLSGGAQLGGTSLTTTVNNTYQYLQFDYTGTTNPYFRAQEIYARAPSSAQIDVTAGYNLMALRPGAQGGPGPIPISDPLYFSGWRVGSDANNIVDLNIGTILVQENINANAGKANFFVLPLNNLYRLTGFATGAYHGQSWSGLTIEYTADSSISAGTTWNQAYTQATSINSSSIAFSSPVDARFVRVSAPTLSTTANGAMSEFELYAAPLPEPAALSLIGMAMVGLLKRRRV